MTQSEGEQVLGRWHVYIGDEGPTTAKVTGTLAVTHHHVRFEAGISLAEDAGTQLGNRILAFRASDARIDIPFADIADVHITRRYWLLKSLHIVLKSGDELTIRFGAMSPKAAHDLIKQRISPQAVGSPSDGPGNH